MKLSIIMPAYNSEAYIEHAILSVKKQDLQETELIMVDDGSTDNTGLICRKYESECFHYIRTENLGAGHARNIAMEKAKGDWISFLDSDDLYLTDSLNEKFFHQLAYDLEEGVDIICTPRVKTDMNLLRKLEIIPAEEYHEIKNHIPRLEFWTCIYRREFLSENKVRFYEYKKQDVETAFRYLAFSSTEHVRVNNDMYFYLQRDNPNSNTHTWNWYYLNEIKSAIYFDLFKRTKEDKDKPFLASVALEQVNNYYTMCLKQGYNTIEGIGCVHRTIKELKKLIKPVPLEQEYQKLAARVFKLDWLSANLMRMKKHRIMQTENIFNSYSDMDIDLEEVFERLEVISRQLTNVKNGNGEEGGI